MRLESGMGKALRHAAESKEMAGAGATEVARYRSPGYLKEKQGTKCDGLRRSSKTAKMLPL